MSESTNATKPGRTPTEHTLQDSFYELMGRTKGRMFIAIFSSNMNRIQMIINAAHQYGRKVALDGRSILALPSWRCVWAISKFPKEHWFLCARPPTYRMTKSSSSVLVVKVSPELH